MSVRRVFPAMGLLVLAGCTPGGPAPAPPGDTGQSTETSRESVTPSITRDVPPEQRRVLTTLSSTELCGLVTTDELRQLAFPVNPGQPREIGSERPAKGCTFPAPTGIDSILIAAQPAGYGQLGRDEVQLGPVPGTKTLSVNDCTVYADVQRATLQVTVMAAESDTDQCDAAESVAQYVVPALSR